jgi:hypothetical protein
VSFSLVSSCFRKGLRRLKHFALHGFGFLRFPADNLQVKHEDAVKDRHQEQRDKCCDGKAADLRVTQRLPQRAAF